MSQSDPLRGINKSAIPIDGAILDSTRKGDRMATELDYVEAKTIRRTVADNVRGFRQLRSIDQAVLARRMEALGIEWRQVTVSEVERDQRNVTVSELLALAFALGATIEQLLDPRGPERSRRGPWLSFSETSVVRLNDPDHRGDGVPADRVVGLVCTHAPQWLEVDWDDDNGKVKSWQTVTDL
jgi:transcriptional regulator with XRE-family HTH domain